jgi:hypothetical protein
VSQKVAATSHSVQFTGLLEDCHQRYQIQVSAETARGSGGWATSSSFRPSGIVTPGKTPPYVVILVDGIASQQPGFVMNPYYPVTPPGQITIPPLGQTAAVHVESVPSYCPESWYVAPRLNLGTEFEANFAASPNGPWSFFHKWNHGETDQNGQPTDGSNPGGLLLASEPQALPNNAQGLPQQTLTHSFMLDAIAAQGAVILPFSYNSAILVGSMANPRFIYPGYTKDQSTPGLNSAIDQQIPFYATRLQAEVGSILNVWPQTKIVIVGHSQGGLVAFAAWEAWRSANQTPPQLDKVFTLDSPINGVCPMAPLCLGPPTYPDYNARGQSNQDPTYLSDDGSSGEQVRFIGTYNDSPFVPTVFGQYNAYGTGAETLEVQMLFNYQGNTDLQIKESYAQVEATCANSSNESGCPVAPPDHISECTVDYYNIPGHTPTMPIWVGLTGHFVVKYCPGDVAYFNQTLGLQYSPPTGFPTARAAADALAIQSGYVCMKEQAAAGFPRVLTMSDSAVAFNYFTGACGATTGVPFIAYVYKDGSGWYPHSWAGTQQFVLPGFPPAPAQIAITSGCVNVRQGPSTTSATVACWPAGTWYETSGSPDYQDGHIWWRVQTGDLAPDGSLTAVHNVGWADLDFLLCGRGARYYPGQQPVTC